MIFKRNDILGFDYSLNHPDCMVFASADDGTVRDSEWVHLLSADGDYITYKRGFLLSEISAGRIFFKRYASEFGPRFIIKKFEYV